MIPLESPAPRNFLDSEFQTLGPMVTIEETSSTIQRPFLATTNGRESLLPSIYSKHSFFAQIDYGNSIPFPQRYMRCSIHNYLKYTRLANIRKNRIYKGTSLPLMLTLAFDNLVNYLFVVRRGVAKTINYSTIGNYYTVSRSEEALSQQSATG